jgi:hypothetical protein
VSLRFKVKSNPANNTIVCVYAHLCKEQEKDEDLLVRPAGRDRLLLA